MHIFQVKILYFGLVTRAVRKDNDGVDSGGGSKSNSNNKD